MIGAPTVVCWHVNTCGTSSTDGSKGAREGVGWSLAGVGPVHPNWSRHGWDTLRKGYPRTREFTGFRLAPLP